MSAYFNPLAFLSQLNLIFIISRRMKRTGGGGRWDLRSCRVWIQWSKGAAVEIRNEGAELPSPPAPLPEGEGINAYLSSHVSSSQVIGGSGETGCHALRLSRALADQASLGARRRERGDELSSLNPVPNGEGPMKEKAEMKTSNEIHGPRRFSRFVPPRLLAGERDPRWRVGLVCGLLACLAVGCSRVSQCYGNRANPALGGRVETDPDDKAVVKVWLEGTDADDNDMQVVARLPKLRELYLRGTQLTDDGMKNLAELSRLQILDLSNTAVGDAGIDHLKNLPALTRLLLRNTKITVAGLDSLSSLPGLQELHWRARHSPMPAWRAWRK